MTMTHDQANDRLVDFLYETLPDDEQAAVASHLAGCPLCAAEVKAWKKVRAHASSALRGPLDEAPPPHLHEAILAAARAAERAPKTARVPAQMPPKLARKGGWWEHWRKAWVVPAFAMAAVFCLFVISRNTLFRSRVGEEVARDQITTWEKSSPPAAPAPEVAKEQPPRVEAESESDKRARTETPSDSRKKAVGKAETKTKVAASGGGAVARRGQGTLDDLLDGPAVSRPATAYGARASAKGETSSPPRSNQITEKRPALPGGGAAAEAPTSRRFAAPPPPVASAPAMKAAPKPAAPRKAVADDNLLDELGPSRSPPAASAHAARVEAAREDDESRAAASARPEPAAAPANSAAEGSASEDESPLSGLTGRADEGSPPSDLAERVRRADRAFQARDWSSAARLYRALVERFPRDPRVPTWKQKAQEAERASTGR